jgi:hypothetical protein
VFWFRGVVLVLSSITCSHRARDPIDRIWLYELVPAELVCDQTPRPHSRTCTARYSSTVHVPVHRYLLHNGSQ